MRFLTRPEVAERFKGKSVAIVGSGPGATKNPRGLIDSFDSIVRVNNYKLLPGTGTRTDIHYSFYGKSIKKTAQELRRDGVKLCLCKCPDAEAIDSEWHRLNGQHYGTDFRWIYRHRQNWWFCDTYIPDLSDFLVQFELLDKHVPTTGFAAILDILSFEPAKVYLTGFDFFRSFTHNVNESWRPKNTGDPIRHVPEQELAWLAENWASHPLTGDAALMKALQHAGEPFPEPPPPEPRRGRKVKRRVRRILKSAIAA